MTANLVRLRSALRLLRWLACVPTALALPLYAAPDAADASRLVLSADLEQIVADGLSVASGPSRGPASRPGTAAVKGRFDIRGNVTRFVTELGGVLIVPGRSLPAAPVLAGLNVTLDTAAQADGRIALEGVQSDLLTRYARAAGPMRTVDRTGLSVGWEHHEEAIPIHLILDQWETAMPGEPARRRVIPPAI
jgi:hypothetical protein